MSHVPCVAEEEHAFFCVGTLFGGWEEGVGHASETVLLEGSVKSEVDGGGELGEDFVDDNFLEVCQYKNVRNERYGYSP